MRRSDGVLGSGNEYAIMFGDRPESKPASLTEQFLVHFLVETDYQLFSNTQGRRPQVTGRPEHQLEDLLVGGRFFLQVQVDDLLPLADEKFIGLTRHLQRGRAL